MPKTSVLVAAAIPPGREFHDLNARFVCDEIRSRPFQMTLVEDRILHPSEVQSIIGEIPETTPCALVLVGPFDETDQLARDCLGRRANLVVLRVAIEGEVVQIAARDPRLKQLIDALQELVSNGQGPDAERSYQIQLPAPANEPLALETSVDTDEDQEPLILDPPGRLLEAAIKWAHALLRASTARLFETSHESVEFTRVQIVDWLDTRDASTPLDLAAATEADEYLEEALRCSGKSSEPLARMVRGLDLDAAEFRLVVLALAPELDVRHQNWISLLLDDPGRRTGTLGLYEELLGFPSRVAAGIGRSDRLARWRLFEGVRDVLPAADLPLRLDPPLRAWLLGDLDGIENDLVIQRVLREAPWAGAQLVHDEDRARDLVERTTTGEAWTILAGDGGPATWRAIVEAGAKACGLQPIRVELNTAFPMDPLDGADTGMRLARLGRLTGRPLFLDAGNVEASAQSDASLEAFFGALGRGGVAGGIVTVDSARVVRLLGPLEYSIEKELPSAQARIEALRRAAIKAGASFTDETAESLANLYPLQIDGIEQAMQMALARPLGNEPQPAEARFITACKEVSAQGASGLAQRIEPIFNLSDVVLPDDRKAQLEEIVDNIRYAPKVLEGWKFRDQLPYGLGVTALFHGPSGTGKTMASMAVAKALGVQILRIDLSRVVSKYIGDTEKNIDRIFQEAQLSGAALVIDEADGLLARRGEVKDAHDRYANLEVAYLLQRMEAYEGLAILTTNLRQNLDSAFLRRLRFIIDFPRPDAAAREEIWRRCLPTDSHTLGEATFRLLARRLELTGGSIRQITLRAAFLAAAAHSKIGPEHVTYAVNAEFAKLGMPSVELDLVDRRVAA